MSANFVAHLRCHSEFSLSHGMIRLSGKNSIGALASKRGIGAIALTDTNNLHGAVRHQKSCLKHGVKPIFGCHALFERKKNGFYATLLCENELGYVNLSKLLSESQLHNEGRISSTKLSSDQVQGLIMLVGYDSDVGIALRQQKPEIAQKLLASWVEIFGQDNLAVELSFASRRLEEIVTNNLATIAAEEKVCCVAAHPAMFPDDKDFEAHEVRACIATSRKIDDPDRPKNFGLNQSLITAKKMQQLFKDWPEAIDNANHIALRCNFLLETDTKPQFPKLPGVKQGEITHKLRNEVLEGLERICANMDEKVKASYHERIEHELEVIIGKDFSDYFLIVSDLVKYAKENEIPVGPGRGSGAGSLVAYALSITGIDPMQYDLLFERFLNPERTSLPDFDIDFCKDRRDEIINYARQNYGEDCVMQVVTFSSMKAKAVVRDVCRALSKPYATGDDLARLIPDEINVSLAKARTETKDLDKYIKSDPDINDRIWPFCLELEGLPRQTSTHASAMLIAPRPIDECCPVMVVGDKKKTYTISQFDMEAAESIGLIKFDILGLKNLTAIKATERMIRATNKDFSIITADLEKPKTFGIYNKGITTGIFQAESEGMIKLIKNIQPNCLEDIAVAISLFRPGALNTGMDERYLNNRANPSQITATHPIVEKILKPTYGAMIYQEQPMLISRELAGFSLAKADTMRAAIGKKNLATMVSLKKDFLEGCTGKLSKAEAEKLFDEIQEFAGYGFNKSHAVSYALISLQTAYLKAHYPAEFLAASLTTWSSDLKTLTKLLNDAQTISVVILPPCVNASEFTFFTSDKKSVRFGLSSVKSISEFCAQSIIDERKENGSFKDLDDFCVRLPENALMAHMLENLIYSGACDELVSNEYSINQKRAMLLEQTKGAIENAKHLLRNKDQSHLFEADPVAVTKLKVNGLSLYKHQLLVNEFNSLGTTLSGHFYDLADSFAKLADLNFSSTNDSIDNTSGLWIGNVSRTISNSKLRKQGREVFKLQDRDGEIEVRTNRENVKTLNLNTAGIIVVVTGKIDSKNRGYPPTINADNVSSLDDWILEKLVKITVRNNNDDQLRYLLNKLTKKVDGLNQAKCKLKLLISKDEGYVLINTDTNVPITQDLLEELSERCSRNNLKLQFATSSRQ